MSIVTSFKEEKDMAKVLASNDVHSFLVINGVLTLLFGVAVVFWPALSLAILVYLFGAYILISGVLHIIHGITNVNHDIWWPLNAALGLIELGFGVYILRHPHESFDVFIALIGFALIIRGIIQLVATLFDDKSGDTKRWIAAFSGLLAAVVGIFVINQKVAAGVAFVWLLGLYAIVIGVLELSSARGILEDK
jgi:uncharacterized membrane protein HdeD (DUF308 family)